MPPTTGHASTMSDTAPQEAAQRQLIDALRTPARYPTPCDEVEVIETHISWVLLCGEFAYKIKKPVDLGFLDFTSLERRRHYCEEELRLNGRLAPQLYLKVVGIGGSAQAPAFEHGEPFEYAVKMRRFDQHDLLDRMLREQRVAPELIDAIADTVADFHGRIPAVDPDSGFGLPEGIREPVRANFEHLDLTLTDPQLRVKLEQVRTWSEQEFERRRGILAARRRSGFVRECHGDMHLGNMAMHEGELVLFDGIEFNPALYWIDVMSEAAFVFMDLDDHGRGDYAMRFLNRYLADTGDYTGVRVLPYYLCYRAMVRAKIAGIRLAQRAGHESAADRDALRGYLELAHRYTQQPAPLLLITHGLSGSGKSSIAAPLCERLGAVHLRSDRERQRLFGRGGGAGIGAGPYSADATERTYARLAELAGEVLEAGLSVVVDATFLDRQQRGRFAALAAARGAGFRILHFEASVDELRRRVRARAAAGRDISEADLRVLEHQLKDATPLGTEERVLTVDTESPLDLDVLSARIRAPAGH